MAIPEFKTSIPFDFTGTIIRPDWENFKLFVDGIISEIGERIKFLNFEIRKLTIVAEKLDLAEKNQLNENHGSSDIGGINDEPPDETTTEHFDNGGAGSGGQAPLDEDVPVNPMYNDDGSTSDLINFIKTAFVENIKYRRSYLSYKVFKIKDLIEQYQKEILSLGTKQSDWITIKIEIERRFLIPEFWELRENWDASEEPWVNSKDYQEGPRVE